MPRVRQPHGLRLKKNGLVNLRLVGHALHHEGQRQQGEVLARKQIDRTRNPGADRGRSAVAVLDDARWRSRRGRGGVNT